VVAGRTLTPTSVFNTYWRFAAARQAIYLARLQGIGGSWSDDPILRDYRFTNVYRAADRVSQYLIQKVIYDNDVPDDPENVVFRVLLFKVFNRISTWHTLERELGAIEWRTFG
jgi:5-hmdU DNA kinase, helical domain